MTSTRSRINRNRRKRVHAAEQRSHDMQVDGVAHLTPTRHEVQVQAQVAARRTEERQWQETWSDAAGQGEGGPDKEQNS